MSSLRETAMVVCAALALAACERGATPGAPATGGPATQGAAPGAAPAGAALATSSDEGAARAAYDEGVKLHLAGDDLEAQRAFVQVAARFPETRHGRAAFRRATASGLAPVWAGMTAAIAIPAFMKYQARAKSAQARLTLSSVVRWAGVQYAQGGRFKAAGPVPAEVPAGTAVTITPDDWTKAGFEGFSGPLETKERYQYQLLVSEDGKGFTARALGDLDGDGMYSTFEQTGKIGADGAVESGPVLEMYGDE